MHSVLLLLQIFNYTSRYLDSLHLKQMVNQIYPTELQLNKTNSFNIEATFLDLDLPRTNGIV